jgi:hypothetical protein
MKSNASDDGVIKVINVDLREQLSIYDSLPLSWRLLVGALPVPQDLREVKGVLEKYGEERGRELILEVYRRQYPGWRMGWELS